MNQFGKTLYELFFYDYTKKLWGVPADKLSADWGKQRIRNISLIAVLMKALRIERKDEDKSFIKKFFYPAYGAGQMWDSMAAQVVDMGAEILYNKKIVGIEKNTEDRYVLRMDTGDIDEATIVLSSMPLRELLSGFSGITRQVREIGRMLSYRDMIIVAIEFEKKYTGAEWEKMRTDSWIYVQQESIQFGRIQFLNNWSPYACANSDYILLEVEFYCSEDDEMWNLRDEFLKKQTIQGLCDMQVVKQNIVVSNYIVKRVEKAYPIYNGGYNEIIKVQNWVNQQHNLYCVGRNGQHHYNNMDHSMLTGIEAAKCILDETRRKERIWKINIEDVYQEE